MHFNIYLIAVSILCTSFTLLRYNGVLKTEQEIALEKNEIVPLATLIEEEPTLVTAPHSIIEEEVIVPKKVKPIKKKKSIKKSKNYYHVLYEEPEQFGFDEYIKTDKEWSAFPRSEWNYTYDTMSYTERELMALSNVIYRESTSSYTPNRIIDQYLVSITSLRVVQNEKRGKANITDMLTKGTFTYVTEQFYTIPTYEIEESSLPKKTRKEYWLRCKQVALDVINCKIPKEVPYLPTGTFYYHNARLDKNVRQKKHLEKTSWCIASSVKDHFYFMQIKYTSPKELKYLVDNNIENPIPITPRKCKNGNKKLLLLEYKIQFEKSDI